MWRTPTPTRAPSTRLETVPSSAVFCSCHVTVVRSPVIVSPTLGGGAVPEARYFANVASGATGRRPGWSGCAATSQVSGAASDRGGSACAVRPGAPQNAAMPSSAATRREGRCAGPPPHEEARPTRGTERKRLGASLRGPSTSPLTTLSDDGGCRKIRRRTIVRGSARAGRGEGFETTGAFAGGGRATPARPCRMPGSRARLRPAIPRSVPPAG